jgi:Fe-Mn family superoxide dismutase
MYEAKTFDIPELTGISAKNIEEHLKLYSGYVNHTNLILGELKNTEAEGADAYKLAEIRRRFAFEFDGMRNHELFFGQFEGGAQALNLDSTLGQKIEAQYGSYDAWLADFKRTTGVRGVGWAILYYDAERDLLVNHWVDEQHLGHLTGLNPVLTLDLWEHAYVGDYWSSGKGQYIDDFLANVNWEVVSGRIS